MTVLVVQCRLSSTRLPSKAILPLHETGTILDWVLSTMALVKADRYFLATDYSSEETLYPYATAHGFEIFAGSEDDVLQRFCALIKHVNADTVIRATADNPFLFYEAANALLDEYQQTQCDYITWQGLPHGSGVEVFNAHSLLQASDCNNSAYEHEHVCPALYNHTEKFICTFLPSPKQWNLPSLRTTVDTELDYRKAQKIAQKIHCPASASDIIFATQSVQNRILFVPSTKKGQGTGHLRRCVALAQELDTEIYIPIQADLEEIDEITQNLPKNHLISHFPQPQEYALIVTDLFSMAKGEAANLALAAPVLAIDEGSNCTNYADYLLDIIPPLNYLREPNYKHSGFIPLPKNKRERPKKIEKVLISVGGEDPADLTLLAATIFSQLQYTVTAILSEEKYNAVPKNPSEKIYFSKPINNLRENLCNYDVIVTHYGFTAFEAIAAGCGVVLLGTSKLHSDLAQKYDFALLTKDSLNLESVKNLLENLGALFPAHHELIMLRQGNTHEKLSDFLKLLATYKRHSCPLCQNNFDIRHHENVHGKDNFDAMLRNEQFDPDIVVARYKNKTYRQCQNCGLLYLAWSGFEEKKYSDSYFFDEYREQYGKTYLEDFLAIKNLGVRRIAIIDALYWHGVTRSKEKQTTPTVLDIGCAYGPFLSAAGDAGWRSYGTDISQEAISYINSHLGFFAKCASFPDFDAEKLFEKNTFNAVTLWYVIEHFQNLDAVLQKVSHLLPIGGIFAFSTPSGEGISAKNYPAEFFMNSPSDHYSIWTPEKTAKILSLYGFKIVKILSTGHHPERFPILRGKTIVRKSFLYNFLLWFSKIFSLGDTFEVYCIKVRESNFEN